MGFPFYSQSGSRFFSLLFDLVFSFDQDRNGAHSTNRISSTCTVSSSLSTYNDDHQLYYAHSNINVLMERIKYEGERMSAWYKENHLVDNLNKYQAMIIEVNTSYLS